VTAAATTQHWLLSLFTPGPDDAVDWKSGNYTVIARAGRIDSPAGFGERTTAPNASSRSSISTTLEKSGSGFLMARSNSCGQ